LYGTTKITFSVLKSGISISHLVFSRRSPCRGDRKAHEGPEQEVKEVCEVENLEVNTGVDLLEMQENFENSQIENGMEPLENMEAEEISGQAIEPEECLGLETEVELFEPLEPQAEEIIPEETSMIQRLETEDLSSLEAELFPESTESFERAESVQESEYYG